MKKFFSILINHGFDRIDSTTIGISNDLILIPNNSNIAYIKVDKDNTPLTAVYIYI